MKPAQLIRCLFGRHVHNSRISRDDAGAVRSRCQGCGRRMVRIEEGRHRTWHIEKDGRNGMK